MKIRISLMSCIAGGLLFFLAPAAHAQVNPVTPCCASAAPQRTSQTNVPRAKPNPIPAQASRAPSSQVKYKGIWEPISYPDDLQFYDVFFTTADEGWIAGGASELSGGVILHTTDGGDRWEIQLGDPQSSDSAFKELRFLDRTQGWAVQRTPLAHNLMHTRDGKNWILAGEIPKHHTDYMFTSEKTGVLLEGSRINITADGGRSWKQVFECAAKVQIEGLWQNVICNWSRLQFLTPSIGYAVAGKNKNVFLAKTSDGGATWKLLVSELTNEADDVFFLDENTGFVRVGGPETGQLYKTADGGQTWTGMAAAPGKRILFADPEVGWAMNYRKVSFTTDGGNRWNSREYPFPVPLEAFSLPQRDRGYIVGEHGMIYRYRMVPLDYAAKGMIPAPLISGIDSPLEAQMEQLATQVQEMAKVAGVPPVSTADVSAWQSQANSAAGGSGMNSAGGGSTFVPGTGAPVNSGAGTSGVAGTAPSASSTDAAGGGFTQDVGLSGAAANAFVQDAGQAQATLNTVTTQVPQFVGKYKNLNLLLVGFQTAVQLPAQLQTLKQSFQNLKSIHDPQTFTAAVSDVQTKTMGILQMVRMAFQKR